jgi:hypothetical protein
VDFTAPILRNSKITQRYYVKIFCAQSYPDRSRNKKVREDLWVENSSIVYCKLHVTWFFYANLVHMHDHDHALPIPHITVTVPFDATKKKFRRRYQTIQDYTAFTIKTRKHGPNHNGPYLCSSSTQLLAINVRTMWALRASTAVCLKTQSRWENTAASLRIRLSTLLRNILPSKCQWREVLFQKKLKPHTGNIFVKTECGYVLKNNNINVDRRMNDKTKNGTNTTVKNYWYSITSRW